MNYRRLGRTGFEVSEIGYGAWGISGVQWIGAKDDESIAALNRAIDLGLNFIDTARAYGEGHKVPPKNLVWPAPDGIDVAEVYPGDYVRRSAEQSLENLGLETVDLLQLHVWQDAWLGQGDWLDALEELRGAGKVRHVGISINDHQPANALAAIEAGLVDTVQVIFNVFDQSPLERRLPACREHDIGVIVRVALDEGGLTGTITADSEFPEHDFRRHYFGDGRAAEVERRVGAICSDLGIESGQMAETALRFVLSEPAVSTVIPGMRTIRHVERNVAVGDGHGLPREQLDTLRGHRWERNFYE